MIIGHIGAGFAARRIWPRVSMVVLIVGTFLPDLLRLCLEQFGYINVQSNYYTHVLPWSALVAVGGALVAAAATRQREAGWAVLALVPSHILLDLVSGRKPLWEGGPAGINLDARYWQYELLIELALLVGGWLLLRPDATGRRWPRVRFVVLLGAIEVLVLAYGINERPWLTRCWIWPFTPCDESSWLASKWDHPWTGAPPQPPPPPKTWRNHRH